MGLGGISIWQILIVLVIVILLFGTSKLKNVGSDLGSALKGFKKSMKDEDTDNNPDAKNKDADFDSLEKPEDEKASTVSSKTEKPVNKD